MVDALIDVPTCDQGGDVVDSGHFDDVTGGKRDCSETAIADGTPSDVFDCRHDESDEDVIDIAAIDKSGVVTDAECSAAPSCRPFRLLVAVAVRLFPVVADVHVWPSSKLFASSKSSFSSSSMSLSNVDTGATSGPMARKDPIKDPVVDEMNGFDIDEENGGTLTGREPAEAAPLGAAPKDGERADCGSRTAAEPLGPDGEPASSPSVSSWLRASFFRMGLRRALDG